MKKLKLYLPFEVDFIHNDMHSELIERYGAQGLGVYFMVLMELRNHKSYRCRSSTIKGAARRCSVDTEMLESVLRDFQLFKFHEHEGTVLISSPYIDRVMQPFEEKKRSFSSTVNKKTVTVERPVNGRFTAKHRENIIETKIKTKTTTSTTNKAVRNKKAAAAANVDAVVADDAVVVNEATPKAKCATLRNCTPAYSLTATPVPYRGEATMQQPGNFWETYLEKAIADEQFMQLLAINSGISHLFMKHWQVVIDTFRQHVVLQGNDTSLHSSNEVKAYLANFMRQGTPTQKRVAELLQQHDKQVEKRSPYRFEAIDPATGERSYFGNIIPKEAPPRPHDDTVWASRLRQWIWAKNGQPKSGYCNAIGIRLKCNRHSTQMQ